MSQNTEFKAPSAKDLQMRFSQYRIEKLVAVGGMGAVYRAVQLSVDRTVAFKILSSEYAGNEKFRKRFALEAKAMAKLNHPNIVQLYDFGESGDVIWMAQEWVPGQTVEEVLEKEGAMDPEEAAAMVAQACEGLGYAHKEGLAHRDVKPANMMQDREGNIKVMDFGLAHASYFEEPSLASEEGARYATTEYAGPEIWDMEKEPDHRVDIFALGVLLFEALTGQTPGDPFRAPSEIRPQLDPRFDEVVMRAMQPVPDDRYQSCRELQKALKDIVMTPPAPKRGQLLTGAAPTGPLTPAASGPVPAAPAAGSGPVPAAVPVATAAMTPAPDGVQAATQQATHLPPPAKKSKMLVWIVIVLALILGVVVALIIAQRGKKEPPAPPPAGGQPSAAELAGSASRTGETAQERVARQFREAQERLKQAEEEKKKNPPEEKKPEETKDGEKQKPEQDQEPGKEKDGE